MVIDTSALIAILEQEDGARGFAEAIAAAGTRLVSAATVVEAGIVMLARRGELGCARLDELLRDAQVEVIPVTADHARIAREAYARFGKGRHRAQLNFGDTFTYALARATGAPLLFKGEDFSCTDLELAPPRAR
jgi:ribonuclease VapC